MHVALTTTTIKSSKVKLLSHSNRVGHQQWNQAEFGEFRIFFRHIKYRFQNPHANLPLCSESTASALPKQTIDENQSHFSFSVFSIMPAYSYHPRSIWWHAILCLRQANAMVFIVSADCPRSQQTRYDSPRSAASSFGQAIRALGFSIWSME